MFYTLKNIFVVLVAERWYCFRAYSTTRPFKSKTTYPVTNCGVKQRLVESIFKNIDPCVPINGITLQEEHQIRLYLLQQNRVF